MNQYGKPFLTADWHYPALFNLKAILRCARRTPSSAFLAEGPEIIIYGGGKLV